MYFGLWDSQSEEEREEAGIYKLTPGESYDVVLQVGHASAEESISLVKTALSFLLDISYFSPELSCL